MAKRAGWALLLPVLVAGPAFVGRGVEQAPTGAALAEGRALGLLRQLPVTLEENAGQVPGPVRFLVRGRDRHLLLDDEGMTLTLCAGVGGGRPAIRVEFPGGSAVVPEGEVRAPGTVSVFRGGREDWRTGIRTWRSVRYPGVWPGVDFLVTGEPGRLKYAFRVAPGVDPGIVRLSLAGATEVSVSEDGALRIRTSAGDVVDEHPIAWREDGGRRLPVDCHFTVREAGDGTWEIGYAVGESDATLPLVIDPVQVMRCGYLGGADRDTLADMAIDGQGNVYLVGSAVSPESSFPVAVGPDLVYGGGSLENVDCFVAKMWADGSGLAYCGYIGGDEGDHGAGIAVDGSGAAYVAGSTSSSAGTFPAVVGPSLTAYSGDDAFVAKVRPDGTGLVYCGYIAGDSIDFATDIAIDGAGRAHVVGRTESAETTFPLAVGPDLTFNPPWEDEWGGYVYEFDGFVARVKADGTGLDYCGYVGGSMGDGAEAVAVDADGSAYVVGYTSSYDFPVLVGPTTTRGKDTEGFVSKVAPDGSGFVYSGYLGGDGSDYVEGVAVDASGRATIVGSTKSREDTFPVAGGPTLLFSGRTDAFVGRVSATGAGLEFLGYIGGERMDVADGVALGPDGKIYVAGTTWSDEGTFPIVDDGPDCTFNGPAYGTDAFAAAVAPDGKGLLYCGYIGGERDDGAVAVALDPDGVVHFAGSSASPETSFPARGGPDVTHNGSYDAWVARIGPTDVPCPEDTLPPPEGTVDSFFLPKRVVVKLSEAKPEKGKLVASGFFDTGSGDPKLESGATLLIGGLEVTVPGLEPVRGGKAYQLAEAGLAFSIVPSRTGSSRAKFKVQVTGDLREKIDPTSQLDLRFTSEVLDSEGSVRLTAGKYALGKVRGKLVSPHLYLAKAKASLKGAGQDALKLLAGLATDGKTPAAASDLTIRFGEGEAVAVPGEDFVRSGDRFSFRGDVDGITSVVIDYAREIVVVKGKGLSLGSPPEGAVPVLVSLTLGGVERSVVVRMVRKGKSLKY